MLGNYEVIKPAGSAAAWESAGLIGGSGFVGGNLLSQRPFRSHFSSSTISHIGNERFSTLICAGAPAVMWAANAEPARDRRNLQSLANHIATARFDRLVLISTIAVLDDVGAGRTEANAQYEAIKAYGRNRRELETTLSERHGAVILRLPALFGEGLRKNFVFDLLNPLPSFLAPPAYAALSSRLTAEERSVAERVYLLDPTLGQRRLDREQLSRTGASRLLTEAILRAGLSSRNFTNSRSAFQFYNLGYLARDIERCLDQSIELLHVCSEPIEAAALHRAVLGDEFDNEASPVVWEDVRSRHAPLWGSNAPYLYGRDQVMSELLQFTRGRRA